MYCIISGDVKKLSHRQTQRRVKRDLKEKLLEEKKQAQLAKAQEKRALMNNKLKADQETSSQSEGLSIVFILLRSYLS